MLNRYRREDDGNPEPPPSKMELNEVADVVIYNLKREMELCPRCGREASHFNLLLKTCPHCGHKLTGPELEELQATRQRKSREKKKKTDEDYERSSNV
jgi:ribosomal protein L37E